ncbi:hypothetical protein LPJ66_002937 [Kickxella alabastrina]|uniref:Uncharacterized protein n=1 Tax=Kickxella alabastrina TaxID=61397 RepID=A0ACC1IL89_9FUNG|nr:hypothetical protein LPJ66_002937 [Kickxella alabastrina]
MTNSYNTPRLQTSPNVSASGKRHFPTASPQLYPLDGFRSLPVTPQTQHSSTSLGSRNVWLRARRDRQKRMATILEGRTAGGQLLSALEAKDEAEKACSKDLAKAMRQRAREVGWMSGIRSRPKLTYLSPLANELRSTLLDEGDLIDDAVQAAEQAGILGPGELSVDFEDIQEIAALRQTFRHLLRVRLEHPDAATRKRITDLMGRINNAKKNLRIPVLEPMGNGPSFFFPASKFSFDVLSAREQAPAGDDDYAFSSSSDDSSDDENDEDEAAFQRVGSSGSHRGNFSMFGRKSHVMHTTLVHKYIETLHSHWPNGAPHLMHLLVPLPQSGSALFETLNSVFKVGRSKLRKANMHYLFGVAAAQVGCLPLVYMSEARVLKASHSDDGDAHEAVLSKGISAASPHMQLLARYSSMLEIRPWDLKGSDIRLLVDEYVEIHREQTSVGQKRPRGDSTAAQLSSPHLGPNRSISTTAVGSAGDFARRSIEEAAVRDFLHVTVLAAVGHGLGTLANSCGLVPDLDMSAGSYFTQVDKMMTIEPANGLSCMPSTVASDAHCGGEIQAKARLSAVFVENVEQNTTELIARLGKPAYASSSSVTPPAAAAIHSSSQPQIPLLPQPPASMLRSFSGGDSRVNGYYRTLTHVIDPMDSPAPQFAAYCTMRARKLAKYELPTGNAQRSPLSATVSPSNFPKINQPLLGLSTLSLGLPVLPVSTPVSSAPKSVHLSQREDLRWDVINDYLRQQLSVSNDHLGMEVITARGLTTRRVFDLPLDGPPSEHQPVFMYKSDCDQLNLASNKIKWKGQPDPEAAGQNHTMDLKPKSYHVASMLSLSSSNVPNSQAQFQHANINRAVDMRQFHDAIWHFTLSLFHIFEEYYFYTKFKDEATPECTQDGDINHDGAIPVPYHSCGNSNVCTPEHSPEIELGTSGSSLGLGKFLTPTPNSNSSPQYQKWITEELKAHIRNVVRNSSSISGLSAQPPVATGLNFCVEEMIHINLIISLAKRQAEIIHGVRAIREFEGNLA